MVLPGITYIRKFLFVSTDYAVLLRLCCDHSILLILLLPLPLPLLLLLLLASCTEYWGGNLGSYCHIRRKGSYRDLLRNS